MKASVISSYVEVTENLNKLEIKITHVFFEEKYVNKCNKCDRSNICVRQPEGTRYVLQPSAYVPVLPKFCDNIQIIL